MRKNNRPNKKSLRSLLSARARLACDLGSVRFSGDALTAADMVVADKKLENQAHSVALFQMYNNFVRVHLKLRG